MSRSNWRLRAMTGPNTRQVTDGERAELQAYARWYMHYESHGLRDCDLIEAFKAGRRSVRAEHENTLVTNQGECDEGAAPIPLGATRAPAPGASAS